MTDADTSRGGRRDDDKGLGTHANELLSLVVAYAKQETLVPLKSLGRYIAWGVMGAVLLTTGGVLLTLAAVRAVQAETGRHLSGHLTWVPYAGGALVALMGVIWALLRITKGDKAVGGQR
jgi:cytochrome c biogenesis protein CcdA